VEFWKGEMNVTEKVHDRMVERTRHLLKETLINLIEEKGFNNITVKNLMFKAKLNRGTFYLHYRDKYDLIEHVQDELLDGMQQHMLSLNPQDMIKYHLNNTPYPPMVQIFQYIKENEHIFKGLLGSKGDPAFPKKMKVFFKNGFFADVIKNQNSRSIPEECFSAYATSAFLGIIEEWLDNDMRYTPEEMAIFYSKIKFFGTK
jgi:AcrR family transcriptional regulator